MIMRHSATAPATRGFTLIEVLVALVIVAFGMGALLAALSAAAANVGALRDKTLAQWIALNQITDTRLNLQAPTSGTKQGDLKNFGNGDWHWQQDVTALTQIPGLLQITVSVRRITADTPSTKSSSTTTSPNWLATVVGFRGSTLAAASGEVPDWSGTGFNNSGGTPSSSGAGTSGNIANPGTATTPTNSTAPINPSTPTNPLTPSNPTTTPNSSSGGN
jgi:general secretion pathway protein I